MDEIEDTVVPLELGNARLEELRDDLKLENEELRKATEEKGGENARLKLILSNARSAAKSLETSPVHGQRVFGQK